MDIKFFSILFIGFCFCCKTKPVINNYTSYCTKEQKYCIKTIIDTAKLIGNHFQHFPSYTSIMEYDTTKNIGYEITWGNCKPDIDWGPFTNYTYDTLIAKYRLNMGQYKEPIYSMKVHSIKKRKYMTICNELRGMGIIIHSHYYSDSLNILIQTTFINEFDYKKIDVSRHYKILENTEIFQKE